MVEQDGNKQFNISERLEDLRREHEALRWEGTFRDYFELVAQNPRIAQLSHARINDMVHAAGIERLNEGTQHEILSYNFFAVRTLRHRRTHSQDRRVFQIGRTASRSAQTHPAVHGTCRRRQVDDRQHAEARA